MDHFLNWITQIYYPTSIVFSTKASKDIIMKNNLSPSEFLRPFGILETLTLPENVKFDTLTQVQSHPNPSQPIIIDNLAPKLVTIKNFRLDFEDSENFQRAPRLKLNELTDNLLQSSINIPEWSLNDSNNIIKWGYDYLLKELKNYSLPWFNEFEKMYFEFMKFNEYELYQQPFAYFYFCTINDQLNDIIPEKNKMPSLIHERIYEIDEIPAIIIILIDKSNKNLEDRQIDWYAKNVKSKFSNYHVYTLDINSNDGFNNPINKDIWLKYINKSELYNQAEYYEFTRGNYLSDSDREIYKKFMEEVITNLIITKICKIMLRYEEEITQKKRGFKNQFKNLFSKGEKKEINNFYGIKNLSDMERKEYLLSIIYFYLRNYKGAYETIKFFISDVPSSSSPGHQNAANELKSICEFITKGEKNESNFFEDVFNTYKKSEQNLQAFRFALVIIKMMESKKKYDHLVEFLLEVERRIPHSQTRYEGKTLAKSQIIPRIAPLLYEKSSYYFLLKEKKQIRIFIRLTLITCKLYLNEGDNYLKYVLNLIGNALIFLDDHGWSFAIPKGEFNRISGDICNTLQYYEGSIRFYKNCIEIGKYTENNLSQQYGNLIKCLKFIEKKIKSENSNKVSSNILLSHDDFGYKTIEAFSEMYSLTVPEIDNGSIVILDEQDYSISNEIKKNSYKDSSNQQLKEKINSNWILFNKYSDITSKKIYLNITEQDLISLKNLDSIINNVQNFSNFYSKRNYDNYIGSKIYIRFNIKNPINYDLEITKMKLICEIIRQEDGKVNPTPLNDSDNTIIEYQEISLTLNKFQNKTVELYCKPLIDCQLYIKGVEIIIENICIVKHYFNKKNLSKLYNYRNRNRNKKLKKRRTSSVGSTGSGGSNRRSSIHNFNKKIDITFNIIDRTSDINVEFLMGNELTIFKDQLIFYPIKIINKSKLDIKRFCIFFKENYVGGNYMSINNESILCDYIYKEIELFNNKKTQNKNSLECTVYVPICPKKCGILCINILAKFEEEFPIKNLEVRRYLLKINVKESINIDFNTEVNKISSSEKGNEEIYNFTLNAKLSLINKNLEKFNVGEFIYANNKYVKEGVESSKNLIPSNSNSNNSDCEKEYYKFYFSQKSEVNDSERLHNKDIVLKWNDIVNFTNQNNYKFIPDEIKNDPLQSHIKYKFSQLLLQNHVIFTWDSFDSKNKQNIEGLFIHKIELNRPEIDVNYLYNLFNEICKIKTEYIKTGNDDLIINLKLFLNRKNLLSVKEISSYDIYIEDDDELNWLGPQLYYFQNREDDIDEEESEINFSCLCNKKGWIDVNKITIKVYVNGGIYQYSKITLFGCPSSEYILNE